MSSIIKVDNIQDQCGSAVVTKCGSTTTVGAGACKSVTLDADTVTLGRCGATVQLAAGASQTGFGRTGTVDWDTTAKTTNFTAVSGNGYFVNTTSGAITVTLPATPSAGDIVSLSDYTNTWQTNNVTVARNGSPIGGIAADATLSTEGQSVTFVYVDGTEGWKNVQDSTSNVTGSPFIQATGGTVTTCGDFKIHTFTSPGTFCVSSIAQCSAQNTVGYLVIAGGGSGGGAYGGGGGAGGFREGRNVPVDNFTASPLVANAPTNAVTITATAYPITVGGGGAGTCSGRNDGSNSVFSTITSAGGGGGRSGNCETNCVSSGGSGGGGGGGGPGTAGLGNTPPVAPPQGNPGGVGTGGTPPGGTCAPNYGRAGGGGAGGTGGNSAPNFGGPGGNGVSSSITGSSVTRAGGGGGGIFFGPATAGSGGPGGGGAGSIGTPAGGNGTANTGGGGGGNSHTAPGFAPGSGSGGSGIVIIRYKYQ